MNAVIGLFPQSEAADSAVADLRLQGFSNVRLEPCPDRSEHPSEAPEGEKIPVPAGARPGSKVTDSGGFGLGGWSSDGSGWALLNLFQINESQHDELGEQGATFVIVETSTEQAAVAQMILERNGAERILPLTKE